MFSVLLFLNFFIVGHVLFFNFCIFVFSFFNFCIFVFSFYNIFVLFICLVIKLLLRSHQYGTYMYIDIFIMKILYPSVSTYFPWLIKILKFSVTIALKKFKKATMRFMFYLFYICFIFVLYLFSYLFLYILRYFFRSICNRYKNGRQQVPYLQMSYLLCFCN